MQVVLGNPGITALNNGARAIDLNDVSRGITLTREALESDLLGRYNVAKAYNNLCVAYFKLKLFEEALGHCDEAISLSDKNWTYYNNRAGAHWGLGSLEDAVNDYRMALELNPNSEKVQSNLELAYKALRDGREPEARPGA